jgi:uncharacterized damage-inducible protein DinB
MQLSERAIRAAILGAPQCDSRRGNPSQKCGKLNSMTFDELNSLVDYNYWARDRLLDAVSALTEEQFTRDMGSSFASVRDTIAHICNAESIWIWRWIGRQPTGFQKPERIPDVAAARAEWAGLEREMRDVLRQLGPDGVLRTIEYRDTKGAAHSGVTWQMVQHVVNHGSYHRGQVTTMLRQLGAHPPKSMDLIAYYREKREEVASRG